MILTTTTAINAAITAATSALDEADLLATYEPITIDQATATRQGFSPAAVYGVQVRHEGTSTWTGGTNGHADLEEAREMARYIRARKIDGRRPVFTAGAYSIVDGVRVVRIGERG